MLIVNNGIVTSARIKVDIYSRIEHGPMADVSGIILHQTSRDDGLSTLVDTRSNLQETVRIS